MARAAPRVIIGVYRKGTVHRGYRLQRPAPPNCLVRVYTMPVVSTLPARVAPACVATAARAAGQPKGAANKLCNVYGLCPACQAHYTAIAAAAQTPPPLLPAAPVPVANQAATASVQVTPAQPTVPTTLLQPPVQQPTQAGNGAQALAQQAQQLATQYNVPLPVGLVMATLATLPPGWYNMPTVCASSMGLLVNKTTTRGTAAIGCAPQSWLRNAAAGNSLPKVLHVQQNGTGNGCVYSYSASGPVLAAGQTLQPVAACKVGNHPRQAGGNAAKLQALLAGQPMPSVQGAVQAATVAAVQATQPATAQQGIALCSTQGWANVPAALQAAVYGNQQLAATLLASSNLPGLLVQLAGLPAVLQTLASLQQLAQP